MELFGLSRKKQWCPGEDSNLHVVRHTDLNRARLPIPPPGQSGCEGGVIGLAGQNVNGEIQQCNHAIDDFRIPWPGRSYEFTLSKTTACISREKMKPMH